MFEIKNLSYKYSDGHEALKNITFSFNYGEKIALVGANGSGKSTLLLNLSGAFEIQNGEIKIDGIKINSSEILRQKIGLIFQEADDQLLMPTVIEDAAFSLTAKGIKFSQARKTADEILKSLGISHLSSRPPHKLSGGEKRLVTFAGVMASNPQILALDEPTANLDPKARRKIINLLRESDKTILLATHDLDMALDICNRALILSEGSLSTEGKLPELFEDQKILEINGLELPLRYQV